MTIYIFFTLKFLFESEFYTAFQVICMINTVFLLQFCRQPIFDLTRHQIDNHINDLKSTISSKLYKFY